MILKSWTTIKQATIRPPDVIVQASVKGARDLLIVFNMIMNILIADVRNSLNDLAHLVS